MYVRVGAKATQYSVVIHAIVTSHLIYCNSLLYVIPKYQQDRLQRILNAAVRIVCLVP